MGIRFRVTTPIRCRFKYCCNARENVQQIQASRGAFAAIHGDGSVISWGTAKYGGNSSAVQAQLKNANQIRATDGAFAASLCDGSIVTVTVLPCRSADEFSGDGFVIFWGEEQKEEYKGEQEEDEEQEEEDDDQEDLESNEPDAEIGMKSRKTRLGEADAFISHSWHDDPVEKWRALQAWRRKLACLPIYLASCSRLVVICGETYLERLWCITELFVFLEMGGSPSNLEVIVLPDPSDKIAQKIKTLDQTSHSTPQAAQGRNFALENARCFEMETTDILLGVLEAGRFGLEGIRKLVQDRFVPGSWQLAFETDPKAVATRSTSSLAAPDASVNEAVPSRSTSSLKVPEAVINMVMQTKAYAAGSSSPKAPEAVVAAAVNETKAQACTSRSGSSLKAPSFISSETKAGTSRSSSSLAMRVLNLEAFERQLHPPAVREEDGSIEESDQSDTSEAGFSI
eukprot:s10_g30.t1